MKALITTFFCLLFSLSAYAEEELYVQLAGETPVIPLFVSPIENKQGKLPLATQNSLREVLLFDLNHNGMTRVLTAKEIASKPSLQGQEAFDAPLHFDKLKNESVLYLLKLRLEGSHLFATLYFVNGQKAQKIDGIELTNDAQKDRVKIHALSNVVHELLFGKKGIATSRILYTVKKKIDRKPLSPIWVSEVFEADYDGQNARQVTFDHSLVANPQYIPSPDGSRSSSFLYVSYKIGQPKIYFASLKGGTPKRFSTLRGNQLTPCLNKNANAVAFISDTTGKADLFCQQLSQETEHKPRMLFTAKGAANASPSFSPDGRKIAFVSDKDGSPKIYVMSIPPLGAKLADLKPQLISKRCRENSAPTWSPDGKKLAYCGRNSGDRQIWVYDFETSQERELTRGKGTKENPAWAPNSLHILFNLTQDSSTELYLINLNQQEAVQISKGQGAKLFPTWEPK
jgi:TolB protein